jgi:hypothetical protein
LERKTGIPQSFQKGDFWALSLAWIATIQLAAQRIGPAEHSDYPTAKCRLNCCGSYGLAGKTLFHISELSRWFQIFGQDSAG